MIDSRRPLEGRRICLVYQGSLEHYTRLWEEIAVLQEAGASVSLFTALEQPSVPAGVEVTVVPRLTAIPGPSGIGWKPLRSFDDAVRIPIRKIVSLVRPDRGNDHRIALRRAAAEVDLVWAIDFFNLADVMAAVLPGTRVLYETFDLVPEYGSLPSWRRALYRRAECRYLSRVDGFVTACDGYADYYMERYAACGLSRRPVVRDNMPSQIVEYPFPSSTPLRLLFMGFLQEDRPVIELITAISLAKSDVTLTLMGENRLGDGPGRLVERLGLLDRVRIAEPCRPTDIVEMASAYDVGVIALRGADENERRASTGKLFAYMCAGLAILGSDLPGIARIVDQRRNGVLVAGMEPVAWARAIDRLATMPAEDVDAMKQRSLDAARDYSWERERPAFLAEFERAMGGER